MFTEKNKNVLFTKNLLFLMRYPSIAASKCIQIRPQKLLKFYSILEPMLCFSQCSHMLFLLYANEPDMNQTLSPLDLTSQAQRGSLT